MSDPTRQCQAEGCERTSALPEPYAPKCARHYLRAVDAAVKGAEAQMVARLATLPTCWACGHSLGSHQGEDGCSRCECIAAGPEVDS